MSRIALGATCFNSTLVQLKVSVDAVNGYDRYVFQFYLSSIKSGTTTKIMAKYICFNSTLVQLKDGTRPLYAPVYTSFNSTLVQLKATGKPVRRQSRNRVSILP